jgi:hypothetical protein
MNKHMSERFTKHIVHFPAILAVVIPLLTISTLAQSQGQYTPPPPPPPPTASETTQPAPPPPAALSLRELDGIVGRVALYPDPLLAHVLTTTTYWDDVPEAARWADEHSYLKGRALADAIREDNLTWSPDILALLPFPSILDMMAHDPDWTRRLGEAVLAQRAEVMDAVQRMRKQARKYGYLDTTAYDNVIDAAGYIEILPVNPDYIYVPIYDPGIVFFAPRPGFVIAGAIRFGPAVIVGPVFAAWGWVHPYFEWGSHAIFFDRVPWSRTWINRGYYIHPFAYPWVRSGPRVERHELRHR